MDNDLTRFVATLCMLINSRITLDKNLSHAARRCLSENSKLAGMLQQFACGTEPEVEILHETQQALKRQCPSLAEELHPSIATLFCELAQEANAVSSCETGSYE